MPQITFDHDNAQEALRQFLSGDEEGQSSNGRRIGRRIATPDGKSIAAEIIDPAYLAELRNEAEAWRDHLEPKGDTDLPPGYRPYLHSPTASENRLLPTEPLEDPLAKIFCGKPYSELDHDSQIKVKVAAIECLLRATLDPDDTGAVPILMRCHNSESRDAPQARLLWQIAYKTTVPGLFVRVTGNGFFGETFGIVTGSGYLVTSGWWERETAEQAAAAMARVLPQIDWVNLDPTALTPPARTALKKVFARYRDTGVDESKPEPEPVLDTATETAAADETPRTAAPA
jgi:hypothetical protein